MNPPPDLVALAVKLARMNGLDPAVVCGLIETESGWRPWAIRWEPNFFLRYVAELDVEAIPPCTINTEKHARAISWGLCQVLGQVARERGFGGRYLSELCEPDIGILYGCLCLKRHLRRANGDIGEALLRYNGGGDPTYPERVLSASRRYTEVA